MARLTVKQISQQHQISRATIYVWVEERRFPVIRIGARDTRGKILIDEEEFVAFLRTLRVEAQEPDPVTTLHHIRL